MSAVAAPTASGTLRYTSVPSPIGELLLLGDGHALHGLYMQDGLRPMALAEDWVPDPEAFAGIRTQLGEYFAGRRTTFDTALVMRGTPFQLRVWEALQAIPYGATRTYAGIAAALGAPGACRAVGAANGRNPLSIVVPCHRLVGANGALTGYAGGLAAKHWLLAHEAG